MKPSRLKSRKAIGALIKRPPVYGKGIRAHFSECERPALYVAYVVPKRRFKRAVDRNRIKRLMREAVRQELLHEDISTGVCCLLIYSGNQIPDFKLLRTSIAQLLIAVRGRLNRPEQRPNDSSE